MSSFFESKQAFAQRLKELDLSDLSGKFNELGWTSFSVLAFATDYVPGASDGAVFTREIVEKVADTQDVEKYKPRLKRLFTEAYTIGAHDIQTRADGKDTDEPRRMPNAEREHRLKLLQGKFTGFNIEGEMEPSYSLIDRASDMCETGVVTYIPWERCTKREQEVCGVKIDKIWKPDSEGRIREVSEAKPVDAVMADNLMLKNALSRRGLALEVANVCTYDSHSQLVETLFEALAATPPPGIRAPDVESDTKGRRGYVDGDLAQVPQRIALQHLGAAPIREGAEGHARLPQIPPAVVAPPRSESERFAADAYAAAPGPGIVRIRLET